MIVKMMPSHIPQVVALHTEAFPDGFLTQLGEGILTRIYRQFVVRGFGYVYQEDGHVIGFLAGTLVPASTFYTQLVRQSPIRLCGLLVSAVIRKPRLLVPILKRARALLSGRTTVVSSAIGSQACLGQEGKIAYVLSVAVSPSHRGKGIARHLWLHLLLVLQDWDVHAILQSVLVSNTAANSLYNRMGFKVISRIRRVDGEDLFRWLAYKRGECTVAPDGRVSWHSPNDNPVS